MTNFSSEASESFLSSNNLLLQICLHTFSSLLILDIKRIEWGPVGVIYRKA